MAFYELEPFGDEVADRRHGVATAVLANAHRNADVRPEPYTPADFIYRRNNGAAQADSEPVLLDDAVAQSNLIRAAIFGIAPS